MRVTMNEIHDVIENYYKEKHPEFILTRRIIDKLAFIMHRGLCDTPDSMTINQAYPSICDFLEKDNILKFVKTRQPCILPISDEVIESIENYFTNNFPDMRLCHIYRKSNHPDDQHIYMITAEKNDGTFSCWSSWNMNTNSLNCGHYNLKSEQDGIAILKDLFNDITDEPEKYGMSACEYVENQLMEEEKEQQMHVEAAQIQEENIAIVNRHRR